MARQTREFAQETEVMDVYFCERRHSGRSSPARRSQVWHRTTDGSTRTNHTAITTRPIAPRPAGIRQAVHRGTDCSPITSERERQFGPRGHLHRRKTMVCSGIQRKKFARTKDDLQTIHEKSKIRAGFFTSLTAPCPCVCPWRLVIQKARRKLPKIDPNVSADEWWNK